MKLQILIIILIFKSTTINGQELFFNGDFVDTIEITSYLSAFQFDSEGTTKGKVEILIINKSDKKNDYVISEYRTENILYSIKSDKEEIKKSWKKKYKGKRIKNEKLVRLLKSLQKSESGLNTFSDLSKDKFEKFVNKKSIKKIAKRNDLIWLFRPKYSTREENREFFKGCQSLDTFRVFLAEEFEIKENDGYPIVSDFTSEIEIHLKTKKKNYWFQGKYPNLFRQPWYDLTNLDLINAKPISNLKINFTLYELLPKKFLNNKSISIRRLMDNYIFWYFKRREMII